MQSRDSTLQHFVIPCQVHSLSCPPESKYKPMWMGLSTSRQKAEGVPFLIGHIQEHKFIEVKFKRIGWNWPHVLGQTRRVVSTVFTKRSCRMHKEEANPLEGSMRDNGLARANMSEATLVASRDKQGPKSASTSNWAARTKQRFDREVTHQEWLIDGGWASPGQPLGS